ncbi:hypothetical protein PoB_003099900 [Plakobranchus ocellatus]|uniref:DDE Tnp4 domain-containing protein n=1 Tax=Plakobranchus ocellatus TaxID=259542 RepID=A0AAV4ADK3_9GAST|nr:hypothetical protein PoB_003099900 [Plakobranchus ocellatus]
MRRFPRRDLSDDKRMFNYRLSRARKQIECAFGKLSSMRRFLRKPIEVHVDFAIDIVKATWVLHNYIQNREPEGTNDMDTIDADTDSPLMAMPTTARSAGRQNGDGKAVRNSLMNYFTSPA